MELSRDFKQIVVERIERDGHCAKALLGEAAALLLNGETEQASLIQEIVALSGIGITSKPEGS